MLKARSSCYGSNIYFSKCVLFTLRLSVKSFSFFKKRNSFHKEDVLANSVKFSWKPYISGNMHIVLTTKNQVDGREQWLRRPRKQQRNPMYIQSPTSFSSFKNKRQFPILHSSELV